MRFFAAILKDNKNHDVRGRFATANAGAHPSPLEDAKNLEAATADRPYRTNLHTDREFLAHHTQQLAKATKEQKDAARWYSGDGYEGLNPSLRNGEPLEGGTKKKSAALDKLLASSTLGTDTMLHRGLDWDQTFKELAGNDPQKLVGRVFTDKAFMSTTPQSNSQSFAAYKDATLVISAKKESKGLYIDSISHHSDDEFEVLLPRNSKLLMTKVDIGTKWGKPHRTIHAILL